MNDSPYTKDVYEAYGVTGLAVDQIFGRIAVYWMAHLVKVHQEAVNANNDIQAGNYFQFGEDWGKFILKVSKPSAFVDYSFIM